MVPISPNFYPNWCQFDKARSDYEQTSRINSRYRVGPTKGRPSFLLESEWLVRSSGVGNWTETPHRWSKPGNMETGPADFEIAPCRPVCRECVQCTLFHR